MRQVRFVLCPEIHSFQSTHPQGVRRCAAESKTHPAVSIHAPAGGATIRPRILYYAVTVSIHAPAGGATITREDMQGAIFVSIHAPAGGATLFILVTVILSGFNPRTRRGCDNTPKPPHRGFLSFNPRTRRGCDGASVYVGGRLLVSIHAPAGGATRDGSARLAVCPFQSTHPQGVRPLGILCSSPLGVSIHAPAGGATYGLHA